ncbi:sulfatase [Paenibacillus sp.]|uniref:sulfatase family protein n=1 Tax=Paenibacillus sp. TaxID=58172 RepID=UPI002D28ACDF|nr:sulfatase [Paenibacillus sp.]HZG85412.1 sulfatase [Paenibacillus sp.]
MNIVYIHSHDTGRYIQPYGHAVPTPNLMKLAEGSVVFRHAYCMGPTCSPSRAALLTGMAPHSSGMAGLAHLGFQLNDYQQHLVQFLNRSGYETALAGIQHEAPDIEMIGYQRILGNPEVDMADFEFDSITYDVNNAKAAAAYIQERKGASEPFFLSFGMFNTHLNFPAASSEFNPNYLTPPHPFHDNQQTREVMAGYMTSAKIMDQCAGIVIDAIEEAGLSRETLVIFTTDHGLPFPQMKCNLYDTGIGVAMILRTPEQLRRGEAVDALVSHIDLFPTICDMAGLEPPAWLQGRSLLPLLKKETDRVRNEIFAEVTYHAGYEPMRCIRTDRYKYIKYFDDHQKYVPVNLDQSAMKTFVVEHGLLMRTRPKEMLFDLYLDPVERVNLAEDAQHQAVKEELAERLAHWMKETDDPILRGPVPLPEGGKVLGGPA